MKKLLITATLVVASFSSLAKEPITIYHAGSLSVPFAQMQKAFEAKYPQYEVQREPSGSRMAARKVSELGKAADVMASADYNVINNLLIPNHAKFNVLFATNEMVIAYTDKSKYADEINNKNWTDILLKKDVKVGHSNPNMDPCGYRSMLVTKLAEKYYDKPQLFDNLFGYGNIYSVGKENKDKVIVRPKETDLLALLESNAFDYLFIYKSVAEQHDLKFITLPKQISLKDAENEKTYNTVSFNINGKTPGSVITEKGSAMVYGITIFQNEKSPVNKAGAIQFVKFVLSEEGQKIMQENGQDVINPPVITGDSSILQ